MSEAAVEKGTTSLGERVKRVLPWLLFALALWEPLQYLHLTFLEFSSGDEGVLLAGALRILHGQVPYRDFFFFVAPGSLYLIAGWLRLFGTTLVAARWLAWLVNGVMLLGLALLGKALNLSRASLAVLFLSQVAVGFVVWPIVSHHWMVNAALFLSAACLALSDRGERRGLLFASGALAGAGGLMLQDEGGYWVLLVILLLLLSGGERRWKKIGLFVGGGLVVAGPIVVTLLAKVPASQILDDLLWAPLRLYHDNPGNRVGWGQGWSATFRALPAVWRTGDAWTLANDLGQGVGMAVVFLVFPVAVALTLLRSARLRRLSEEERWPWLVLLCMTGALVLMALHRPTVMTLIFAFPGAFLLILWEWERVRKCQPRWFSRLTGAGLMLPLAITVATTSLPYPYLAPRSSFDFPSGKLTTEVAQSKPSWELLYQFQKRFLQPGQSVFCYDYCSFYSFVLRRVGATPYDNFDMGRFDPAMVHDLLAHLAAKPPDWILLDGRYGPDPGDPVVGWVSLHYRPLARCTGLLIVGRADMAVKPAAHPERR
ncbi:MAG: glycosyltransferase family 39 protein [Acidobacteriota bacterium]